MGAFKYLKIMIVKIHSHDLNEGVFRNHLK